MEWLYWNCRKRSYKQSAFGEETGRSTVVTIGLKEGCYISEDNAIRIKCKWDNGTGEAFDTTNDFVFRDGYEGREQVILALTEYDITCEKIKGTILQLTIPDEKWSVDRVGEKYLKIDGYKRITQYTVTIESFVD